MNTTMPIPVRRDRSDARARQVIVEAKADNVPIRMLLDTGAARSSVPHIEPFTSVAADGVSQGRGASGAQRRDPLIRLKSFEVGPFSASDLIVSVDPEGWSHPSLLGMDVLGSRVCWFRFTDEVLEVDAPPPNETLPLPSSSRQAPRIDVQFDHTVVSAIWDTGAGITIVDRTWAESHPDAVTILSKTGSGTDSAGTTGVNPHGRMAPCRIGDVSFPEHDCGVADLSGLNAHLDSPILMFLGLPLISLADWYVDFPGRRWLVAG